MQFLTHVYMLYSIYSRQLHDVTAPPRAWHCNEVQNSKRTSELNTPSRDREYAGPSTTQQTPYAGLDTATNVTEALQTEAVLNLR
jgi:hypothetical protein